MYTHINQYKCTFANKYLCVCTHVCTYTYTCIHSCVNVSKRGNTSVHVYRPTSGHKYTCTDVFFCVHIHLVRRTNATYMIPIAFDFVSLFVYKYFACSQVCTCVHVHVPYSFAYFYPLDSYWFYLSFSHLFIPGYSGALCFFSFESSNHVTLPRNKR